ncbi:acyl-CoA dehydrogenase family protein [Dietzia sp. PP-33]|uniref:acyl-CoA dehydrogenase family protein n=1 Tax=Dietzia sp. PP-33 TaxID=2957500 RepID=UPI0029AFC0BD|nr:acyl-CoA dehydrogenase family protein [Dietzia sp. PP-33]MDX2357075.1 acyl-CoA/acyl-ACP dehydrogenase [Dietzia sp. PP-33]
MTEHRAGHQDPARNEATVTVDLGVDEDLESMMAGVLAQFSGPTVEPDAAAVWRALSEVGIGRLTAPEDAGGSGAGWAEAATLLRLSAAAGVAVPYAETDLVVGPLRRAAGLDDSGPGTATLAVLGAGGRARRVAWAGATDRVLCVRRSTGTGDEARRYEVADVATDRAQVAATDGTSAVPLGDLTPPDDADWTAVDAASVETAVLRGALARAVQCVGAAEGMLDAAIAHTTERTQFGRALARFQSVQNLVVDIAAETVLARAAVDQAVADALHTDLGGPLSGFRVAVARSVVSQAVAVAVRNAHQVHGAIGTTHEHTLHRLTLPALQWRGEFGSAAFWEARLTDAALAGGMDGAWPMIVEGAPVHGGAAAWLDRVTGS